MAQNSIPSLRLFVDGASRGNPGPAAAGVVVVDPDGTALIERGLYLGTMTNNVAEYRGLLAGIEAASTLKPARLEILSDSELMVRQITGQYRVRSPDLLPLFERAQAALLKLDNWHIRHVPRAQNARADKLANMALDKKRDVDEAGDQSSVGVTGDDPSPGAGGPIVVAKVTLGCDPRQCPATMMVGELFRIGPGTPEGLCVYAAAAVISAAVGMLGLDEPSPPVRVACPRCGARFELTLREF